MLFDTETLSARNRHQVLTGDGENG